MKPNETVNTMKPNTMINCIVLQCIERISIPSNVNTFKCLLQLVGYYLNNISLKAENVSLIYHDCRGNKANISLQRRVAFINISALLQALLSLTTLALLLISSYLLSFSCSCPCHSPVLLLAHSVAICGCSCVVAFLIALIMRY